MEAQLRTDILSRIGEKRLPHVLGVEQEAMTLGRHWGCHETDCQIAAILHDVTKGWAIERQLRYCEEYRIILTEEERNNFKLLHAVTGALQAQHEFQASEAVVSAVRWHTLGRENMTLLEKIVFLADKIEPNRDYEEVASLRELAYTDIDAAVFATLNNSIKNLAAGRRFIHPDTLAARNFYLTMVEEKRLL